MCSPPCLGSTTRATAPPLPTQSPRLQCRLPITSRLGKRKHAGPSSPPVRVKAPTRGFRPRTTPLAGTVVTLSARRDTVTRRAGRAAGRGREKHEARSILAEQGQRILGKSNERRTKTFFFRSQSPRARTPNSPPPPRWPTRTLLPRCVAGTNAASDLVCPPAATPHRPIAFRLRALQPCTRPPRSPSHTGSSARGLPIACGGGRKAPVENGADASNPKNCGRFFRSPGASFLTRRTQPHTGLCRPLLHHV